MRNLILAAFLMIGVLSFGQRAIEVDTLQGAETVFFESMEWPKSIQALCTQTGGTSDGTLRIQASVDGTSWQYVTETDGIANFYPNDTLTITNGEVYLISLKDRSFPYWRVVGAGTSGDSTKVTIKYFKQ